ncbi:hypothetical protein [Arthrobacter sp. HMWF013]|uniref:hypothetical protein n=1 Tax=Arthrobacter sp. HMWF013 TaxID=2056849 RepID=UPI000D39B29C|nr:hypothetical protein [Arthrobacter sp. HMWF013]PTT61443.1 hypothetical protein DBR22_18925 [Arthrobacter sp. HMWF013]
MVYDRERERRDDAVYAEHKRAVAAGGKRVLRRTSNGELHSYLGDEIGFTPGRGQAQVSTWWGMGILMVFSGIIFIGGCWVFQLPLWEGKGPEWGALWVMGLSGFLTPYAYTLARDEYRATRLRKRRGSPQPGTGNVDVDLLKLGQARPGHPDPSPQ